MASFSCLLRVSGRESTSDLSAAHLKKSVLSCASPESHSLQFGGSLMILHLLRWLCRTSSPVASRNCDVAVFLDQLLSGPFFYLSHQLLFHDSFSISIF
jgi:hypothetical protein